MKLRLSISIKLYKDGKAVSSTTKYKKTQAVLYVQDVQGKPAEKWTYGTCRVWYDRKLDYWNEFPFTTLSEFKAALTQDTELDLLKDLMPASAFKARVK